MNQQVAYSSINELSRSTPSSTSTIGKIMHVQPAKSCKSRGRTILKRFFILLDHSGMIKVCLCGNIVEESAEIIHVHALIEIHNFGISGRDTLVLNSLNDTEILQVTNPAMIHRFGAITHPPIKPRCIRDFVFALAGAKLDCLGIIAAASESDYSILGQFCELSLTIFDSSSSQIDVIFRYHPQVDFLSQLGSFVLIRQAILRKTHCCTLEMCHDSTFELHPQISNADDLRIWRESQPFWPKRHSLSFKTTDSMWCSSLKQIRNNHFTFSRFSATVRLTNMTPWTSDPSQQFSKRCVTARCNTILPSNYLGSDSCKKCGRMVVKFEIVLEMEVFVADEAHSFTASISEKDVDKCVPLSLKSLYLLALNEPKLYEALLDRALWNKNLIGTFERENATNLQRPSRHVRTSGNSPEVPEFSIVALKPQETAISICPDDIF